MTLLWNNTANISITKLIAKVNHLKGQQNKVINLIKQSRKRLQNLSIQQNDIDEALQIARVVGLETQKSLQYHISHVVTNALKAVFGEDSYELQIEFVERRNKTECDLYFVRDGKKFSPMEASGGGVVDLASFALRVAVWSMKRPKLRNVIILDEPLRFLSKDLQEKASLIISELSNQLDIQFIIVTHEEELTEAADRLFVVRQRNGQSYVELK